MKRTARATPTDTASRRAAIAAIAFASALHPQAEENDDPATARTDAAARADYLLHCSGCHRTNGAGAPPEVPSLRGPVGTLVATPAGREYIVRVPEVAQSPLNDEDLARLLNWMLREFNAETLPDGFQPMTDREVGAARARVLADPLRARAAIVGAYEPEAVAPEESAQSDAASTP